MFYAIDATIVVQADKSLNYNKVRQALELAMMDLDAEMSQSLSYVKTRIAGPQDRVFQRVVYKRHYEQDGRLICGIPTDGAWRRRKKDPKFVTCLICQRRMKEQGIYDAERRGEGHGRDQEDRPRAPEEKRS